MTVPLAHGGLGGALVETAIVVGIVAVFALVWLRSRAGGLDEEAEGREQNLRREESP